MATVKKAATKAVKSAEKKAPAKAAAPVAAKTAAPAKSVAVKAAAAKKEPTHAEIADLAHSYWKDRGHHHGQHHDDWLRAERELKK